MRVLSETPGGGCGVPRRRPTRQASGHAVPACDGWRRQLHDDRAWAGRTRCNGRCGPGPTRGGHSSAMCSANSLSEHRADPQRLAEAPLLTGTSETCRNGRERSLSRQTRRSSERRSTGTGSVPPGARAGDSLPSLWHLRRKCANSPQVAGRIGRYHSFRKPFFPFGAPCGMRRMWWLSGIRYSSERTGCYTEVTDECCIGDDPRDVGAIPQKPR